MTGCSGRGAVVPPPPTPETGCPAGGSKSNLIKPESDNDKKLVLVLSCEFLKRTSGASVGGENGRDSTNYTVLANGARVHFRFSKPGKSYGTQQIKLNLKDGSSYCHSANMGVRSEGWAFKKCGGNAEEPPPPTGGLEVKLSGSTLTVSKELADAFFRAPKLFYLDGPNEGDKVPFNAQPFEVFQGSGTEWRLPNTNNFKGRHGILFNTKPGSIDPSKVKWGSQFSRPSTKVERDPSMNWDSWGGYLQFEPGSARLYETTPNSLTLRDDFLAATGRIDALVNINETSPGVATSTAVTAVKTNSTWTIPNALSSYPKGNRPNTWRIRLARTPPEGVTYHTSIMQTFIRETEIAANQGKTYPPTTRQ
jgi:hypothetical protein